MRTISLSFLSFFFAISLTAAGQTINKSSIEQRIERVINGLLPETPFENQYGKKASLKDRMTHFHTPGVSIAVIHDNQIEWARGFGVMEYGKKAPVTEKTRFQAASISKPVFAVGVMRLAQIGRLKLDEDVNTYLTSWKVPKNGEWQPRITLRQLLSHSAGLGEKDIGFPGYLRTQRLPSIVEVLSGSLPANTRAVLVTFLPGTQMRYSGGGITIAQQLVMDAQKLPFPTIMRELVLAPMGMSNSTYEQPLPKRLHKHAATGHLENNISVRGKWHVYPEMAAAGLWTTPLDLAKFGIELQRSLKGESNKVLSKESINQMLTPGISESMGLGFFLRGQGNNIRFEHNGMNEGFLADAIFYKDLGIGAVIMINSNEADLLFELERAVAKEYAWPGYFLEEKKAVLIEPKILKGFLGIYAAKNGIKYEVEFLNNKLFLKLKNQSPIELLPKSRSEFFFESLNGAVSFDKNEMTIKQNGNEIKASKEMAKL